ncbi:MULTISPECIES: hypothetical protein [Erythrobacteraceae]|nr:MULTISPECIES: hypothetical protein [Erythrobacteraceae]
MIDAIAVELMVQLHGRRQSLAVNQVEQLEVRGASGEGVRSAD